MLTVTSNISELTDETTKPFTHNVFQISYLLHVVVIFSLVQMITFVKLYQFQKHCNDLKLYCLSA